ncbi:MAG: hypothetical protein EOP59_03225, partial [Sphingomonadales bacterium]
MSGFQTTRRQALALSLAGATALSLPRWAYAAVADLDEAGVDAIVRPFMAAFETPGIGVSNA